MLPTVADASGWLSRAARRVFVGERASSSSVLAWGGEWGPPPPARWAGWPAEWATSWDNDHSGLFGRVAILFACVDLNARSLAAMPVESYVNGVPVAGRSWARNPEPLLYEHVGEAISQVSLSLDLRGNAYLLATAFGADGYPLRWLVLDPDRVIVEGQPPRYRIGEDVFGPAEVCHVRHLSWPREPYGFGPLGALARTLGVAHLLEGYAADLILNGGIAATILRHPGNLTADQALDLQTRWASSRALPGAPRVLSSNIEFEVLGLNPADLAMLDLRTMSDQRIAAVFGVPPPLVGLPGSDGLTYSTIQGLLDFYWRSTLRSRATNIMSALSGWAMPRGHSVALNEDRFVRPAIGERATAYEALIRAGVITPNEARRFEGLPPSDAIAEPALPVAEGAEEVAL